MLDVKVDTSKMTKPKMTTYQALSMQDTVNRALQARMPQQTTQAMPQVTTPNGFGRSV